MTSFVLCRIYPLSWENTISLRWEIYGCGNPYMMMVVETTEADVDATTETSEESDEDAASTAAANVLLLLLCATLGFWSASTSILNAY